MVNCPVSDIFYHGDLPLDNLEDFISDCPWHRSQFSAKVAVIGLSYQGLPTPSGYLLLLQELCIRSLGRNVCFFTRLRAPSDSLMGAPTNITLANHGYLTS